MCVSSWNGQMISLAGSIQPFISRHVNQNCMKLKHAVAASASSDENCAKHSKDHSEKVVTRVREPKA